MSQLRRMRLQMTHPAGLAMVLSWRLIAGHVSLSRGWPGACVLVCRALLCWDSRAAICFSVGVHRAYGLWGEVCNA